MKIDILTLFPESIEGFLNESIIKRAIEKEIVSIRCINFREYSPLHNKQVDDTPYGGGAGMVLRCEPIFLALDDLRTEDSYVVLLTPEGATWNQDSAYAYSKKKHIIMICGHYEGFDERIKTLVDAEVSIGDFVLTGGELPASILVDSIVRLLPGVINESSLESESFTSSLLDYPTYTKPSEYRGLKVPDVLLSGDHAKIATWREEERVKKTNEKRPDLLQDRK